MANERRPGGAAWRILVVDDVPAESWACVAALETVTDQRYEIESRVSPSAALAFAREWRPDLVILDIEMPEMDGYKLAQQLKADDCDASRLFLTKLSEDEDEIEGLELADDYIQKPFQARVFLARVRNILSRRHQPNSATTPEPRDSWPKVDAVNRQVTLPDGRVKQLTSTELKLLKTLVDAHGEAVSYADLIREVWKVETSGADAEFGVHDFSANLYQTVRRVRGKIEAEPRQPQRILNVERVGYRYNAQPDEPDAT